MRSEKGYGVRKPHQRLRSKGWTPSPIAEPLRILGFLGASQLQNPFLGLRPSLPRRLLLGTQSVETTLGP